MPAFQVITLGCKVNQYDGAAVAGALCALGLAEQSASDGGRPDLLVVNTCCVTAVAMAKSRRAVRRALRRWPHAAVLVTGCYADYDPARLAAILGGAGGPARRAAVAGRIEGLAGHILELAQRWGLAKVQLMDTRRAPASAGRGPQDRNDEWMSASSPLTRAADGPGAEIRTRRLAAVKRNCAGSGLPLLDRFPGRRRAFVKVQDGCDAFCAYCVVPYTRPIVQWRPPRLVEQECRNLIRAGHKELVLCGIFLGAYGRSTARRRRWRGGQSLLPALVRRIGDLPGLWRLRLSSLEPGDLSDELLAALGDTPTAAWHFHLPLQSGSPRILRRMNRQYTPDDFRRAVDRIRAAQADAAITTDILVGFPGEGEEDFRLTLETARHAGFSKIHAFAFSAIPGTAAWTYRREAPPPAVVRSRLAELAALERELAADYRAQFVGRTMEALVESPGQAMTDRYLVVSFSGAGPRAGEVATFRITGVHPEGLEGR